MKKIAIVLILFFIYNTNISRAEALYSEIYGVESVTEIKDIAKEIFAKRDPQKAVFIFPLKDFILRATHPAMQKQSENYQSLLKKAFAKVNGTENYYINEILLSEYPYEISDQAIVDLVQYIQSQNSGIIITTPNVTGSLNKIDFFDIWTVKYLQNKNIDLSKGVFADKKFSFNKEMKKVKGSYPSFYQGLLSYNSDGKNNSVTEALSILFVTKLKEVPNVVVAVSDSRTFLESLARQLKILNIHNEFFGILYKPAIIQGADISPEDYLSFWQNFASKLPKVTRKEVDLKSENPYEQ